MKKKENKKIRWKAYILLYIMAIPGLTYIVINNYLPLYGLQIAFRKLDFVKGVFNGDFIGLDNFKFLFATSDAWMMTRNTILYNLLFIVANTIMSIAVAILFNEVKNKIASKIYQTAVLIPFIISMVITSYLAFAFLSSEDGFINNTLMKALGKEPVSWYTEPAYWPFILLFISQWKGIGYSILMYLTNIMGISSDYYEAAALDGASRWQQIKMITLPLIKPTFMMLTILSIGRIFYSDFGLFYQIPMNSGPLYSVTTTIDTYVFRSIMKMGNIPMASAAGFYQSIVGFTLIIFVNLIIRKTSKENALF